MNHDSWYQRAYSGVYLSQCEILQNFNEIFSRLVLPFHSQTCLHSLGPPLWCHLLTRHPLWLPGNYWKVFSFRERFIYLIWWRACLQKFKTFIQHLQNYSIITIMLQFKLHVLWLACYEQIPWVASPLHYRLELLPTGWCWQHCLSLENYIPAR